MTLPLAHDEWRTSPWGFTEGAAQVLVGVADRAEPDPKVEKSLEDGPLGEPMA